MGPPAEVDLIRQLREKTSAGVMECKKALQDAKGDLAKAEKLLKEKGLARAEKKAQRAASEGAVTAYVHAGGRIGVLVEVNCETDFVARTAVFQEVAKDLAMQVAASSPSYVSREEIPGSVTDEIRSTVSKEMTDAGKPAQVIEKIVSGRLEKFYQEVCLLDQQYIKDPNISVSEFIKQNIAKVGENIMVRRFVRYQLGESKGA